MYLSFGSHKIRFKREGNNLGELAKFQTPPTSSVLVEEPWNSNPFSFERYLSALYLSHMLVIAVRQAIPVRGG
jgi:hypothetical protein